MRISAVLATLLSGPALLMLAACDKTGDAAPSPMESASLDAASDASGAVVEDLPDMSATDAPVVDSAAVSPLDSAALVERRDPERLLRFYLSAIRVKDWASAAKTWSLDAQMTPEKLQSSLGGDNPAKLAVGKGDIEGAAGSLYYEAPLVVDYGRGNPTKRGTIVLRRVNDVPGASEEQLNWRIERTSTLAQ